MGRRALFLNRSLSKLFCKLTVTQQNFILIKFFKFLKCFFNEYKKLNQSENKFSRVSISVLYVIIACVIILVYVFYFNIIFNETRSLKLYSLT